LARVNPGGTGNVGFGGFVETFVSVIEGTAELDLSVRRTGGSTGELSVQYTTVVGTADAPADFTPSFGTLVWEDGDMAPKTIIVPITDDNVDEANENFTVVLSNSTGGLASSKLLVTISDRAVAPPPPASPPPTRPPASGAVNVGGSGAIFLELLFLLLIARSFLTVRQLRGQRSNRQN
jgi:hypothetical protein